MQVVYLGHLGDDLTVVNAARVSFDKESKWEIDYEGGADDEEWEEAWKHKSLSNSDIGLIRYLAKHGHWTPFAHPQIMFRIKVPIFVANQLKRHQIGLALNEISRRYVTNEPEFYLPNVWRTRPEGSIKQGSGGDLDLDTAVTIGAGVAMEYKSALKTYNTLLEANVAPEQARMVLPQSMYTEWYWTGSLYAFARVCRQRLDSHAQSETREVAQMIADHIAPLFPVSWPALMKEIGD